MSEKPNPREVLYLKIRTPSPPWSIRIPAAIKKAEGLTVHGDYNVEAALTSYFAEPEERLVALTTGELALAEALWAIHAEQGVHEKCYFCNPLIAFCEKMEKLT